MITAFYHQNMVSWSQGLLQCISMEFALYVFLCLKIGLYLVNFSFLCYLGTVKPLILVALNFGNQLQVACSTTSNTAH